MALFESGEMYLETILLLTREKTDVHSIDVAESMNYSKPSVSRAMGLLKKEGYILMDYKGVITLTEKGAEKAESIYERHLVLTQMLKMLGVDDVTAAEDGCKMEHYISQKSFDAIKKHVSEHS